MPDGSREFLEAVYAEPVAADALVSPGAAAMAALLQSGRYGAARLLASRRQPETGAEVLFVELATPLGQRKRVNDIRSIEEIAVAYEEDDRPPAVYPLREDFPEEVPHFNLSLEGHPRSLCLFDLPAEEILRVLTPYVLLERTRHWLVETAYGRLHGDDQPLDPVFGSSGRAVVLPPASTDARSILYGFRRSDLPGHPVILQDAAKVRADGLAGRANGFAALIVGTAPLPHGRLRSLPRTALQLVKVYRQLGIDLVPTLRDSLRGWLDAEETRRHFDHNLLMVISTPIERRPGVVDGGAVKAFLGEFEAGQLAEALGAILRAHGHVGAPLGEGVVDEAALDRLVLHPMDVHRAFDRPLAQAASGMERKETAAITLIGAGALGSQVALTAAREGLGTWSVYDPDHLMPHNLARHALYPGAAGAPKALALAQLINELLGDQGAAKGYAQDIREVASDQLAAADLVIDASASVPVARWLARQDDMKSPAASIFFSPNGDDLVLLKEGAGRTPRLDELEMSYYWALASNVDLHGHLRGGKGIMPAGGCRTPSMRVAQSRVAMFAAAAARSVIEEDMPEQGGFEIWRLGPDGINAQRWPGDRYRHLEVDGWTVLVREEVIAAIDGARAAAGENETGGILVGAWDRQRRRAYIVGHYDPPPDSQHSPTGFVRGMVGVYQTVQEVEDATAMNLSYIGEWHSHPPRHDSRPSEDDGRLLRWIGDVLAFSDVPPLMGICGDDGFRVIVGRIEASAIAGGAA